MRKILFVLGLFISLGVNGQILYPTDVRWQFMEGLFVGNFGNLHISSDGDIDTIKGVSYDFPDSLRTVPAGKRFYLTGNLSGGQYDLDWRRPSKADIADLDSQRVLVGNANGTISQFADFYRDSVTQRVYVNELNLPATTSGGDGVIYSNGTQAISFQPNDASSPATLVGVGAGAAFTTGNFQFNSPPVLIGAGAGELVTVDEVVGIGSRAITNLTTGNGVYIGNNAAIGVTTGLANIVIGNKAASTFGNFNERLIIENGQGLQPLLFGDFNVDTLKINADLRIRDSLIVESGDILFESLPTGTSDTVLVIDNGVVSEKVLKSKTVLFNGSHDIVTGGATEYLNPGAGAQFLTGTANVEFVCPADGTISDLYSRWFTSQLADGSLVLTVYKNDIATSLTVTVPANTSGTRTYSDTSNSFSVSAGDYIYIVAVNNSASASARLSSITMVYTID